ncbi:hypothetical protein PRZ48_008460 [Zasmidium cellare]|uniref:Cupin type-2 domain-containing protein n=1 Tax=Zasmidium cellare TaxID=395010 RepID=A0ABR0EGA5_ZASCE|nr:hypothetical protein PRZ48_008460 [Zasmidium cellare]
MPLLTPSHVPRTVVSHLNPIPYDHGRALNGIHARGSTYFGTQTVPPSNTWSDGTRSFMAPMSHFHLLQSETFHVVSGRGIWYLGDEVFELGPGDKITIPAWRAHRFENVVGSTEGLTIEFRYDAQFFEMEESFFRNGLTYFDDCRKAGVEPSWLQYYDPGREGRREKGE